MNKVVFFLHRVYPHSGKKDDISVKNFVRALKLIKLRFKVVPLHELLEDKNSKGKPLAAITFDDGYADNYVYAYPILKKMGILAHLFITADRILDSVVRKSLFDYWDGKISEKELYKPVSMYYGHKEFIKNGRSKEFLSWEELNKMKDVFTFGSHGGKHFAFPYRDEIVDFFDGSNSHWTMLLYSDELLVGLPRFPTRSELDIRKFYPSKDLLNFCLEFPKKGNWKEKLKLEVSRHFKTLGEFETEDEARNRIEDELRSSKRKIEERLDVTVDNFSWPFGHYSGFSQELAQKVYKYVFTTKKGFIGRGLDSSELPRVSLGKDLLTVFGRVLTFSTRSGFKVYKHFKKEKVI